MKGSLRQRGLGSWTLTVDLGRDRDGQRVLKYYTVSGTKAAALRRLRELLSTLDHGMDLPDDTVPQRPARSFSTPC